jgi:drug/metabolite transporter (DMT)-like permease
MIGGMSAIALALGSAFAWGCADFLGGLLTRRVAVAAVTVLSQGAGFVALFCWLAADGFDLDARALGIGSLGGLGGGIGLAAYYKALAVGTMSIVAPIAACGAVIPFALSLATGERPSALALGGAAVALGGAVLASVEEHRSDDPGRRRGVLLAIVAAVSLGFFIYYLGLAGKHGETLSALFGARVGSLALLLLWALAVRASLRTSPRDATAAASIGLIDTGANALFVLASARGYLAIVSVLGSLYPIVPVVAGHVFLAERISWPQRAGVALALGGVAVVAYG